MPRAPPGLLLLLMAALAFAATPPLEIINPWLSACDLQPNSTDMQGACSAMWAPGGSLCPLPCPANSTTHQCLRYLTESHKEEVCGRGSSPERRKLALQTLHMRHCCEHAVLWALPMDVLDGGDTCRRRIDALLEVDVLAANVSCKFSEVLTRYDCGQTYSIVHRCENCKEAYRRWVCSSLVPHFNYKGERVRPCLNVCQDVEQQCPYFLPGDRAPAYPTQYAGEPTFLCLDPNIPETGEQRAKSSVGDEDCCYTHCSSPGRGLCYKNNNNSTCSSSSSSTSTSKAKPPEPVRCTEVAIISRTSACRAGAINSGAHRTVSEVCHQWTAWILILITHTNTIYSIIKCLLVMCVNRVRTYFVTTRKQTKRRRAS